MRLLLGLIQSPNFHKRRILPLNTFVGPQSSGPDAVTDLLQIFEKTLWAE